MQAVLKIYYIPFLLLIKQHQVESGKNQAKAREHWGWSFAVWNYSFSLSTFSSKNNKTYSKEYINE